MQNEVHLLENEVYAIIRRIDIDGDAKISFEEFSNFFLNLTSTTEAQLRDKTNQKGTAKPKPEWQRQLEQHRAKVMQTPSKLDANI
jgi:hypothetical protein